MLTGETMSARPAKKIQETRKGMRLIDRFRPEVAETTRDIQPYEPVSSLPRMTERPEMEHFKLDWNESTIPPSPHVRKAVLAYLDGPVGLNIYPQLFSTDLRLKLQTHVGYPADHILVTNGSDDALDLICKTYLNPGDRVLSPYPTYTHFLLFAKSRGAVIDKLHFNDPFAADMEELIAQVTDQTKIVYVVNPNNPTGQLFTNEEIEKLAQSAPHAVILVDEAYAEFAGVSAVDLVGGYENIIVTRSFSKAYGLAGLRVGYLVTQPYTSRQLGRLYNPKSVNQLAQVAAGAVLEDMDYYRRYIDEVGESKELLARWCEHNGLDFRNTPANFVMIRVERVKDVVEALAEAGVYVRDRSSFPQLEGCFRLNVGTVEQTSRIIRRFERVLVNLGMMESKHD